MSRITTASLTLAVASALLSLLATPSRSMAAVACQPPGGLQTSSLAFGSTASGGREVTEYYPGGAYRVTRCDPNGHLAIAETVAPLAVPGGGTARLPISKIVPTVDGYLETDSTYADPTDPGFITAWANGSGAPADVLPPTQWPPPASAAHHTHEEAGNFGSRRPLAHAASDDSCSNPEYHYEPWFVVGAFGHAGYYAYYANESNMPHGDSDRVQITNGHHSWNDTINDCGFGDTTDVVADYVGTTSVTAHSYHDGINVVDFGNLSNVGCTASGTVACTLLISVDGVHFSDIDQRYGTNWTWSDNGGSGFDVWNDAAHESGHAVGMDHSTSSAWLTMYPQVCLGCVKWRTLAYGDVLGFNRRYGGGPPF